MVEHQQEIQEPGPKWPVIRRRMRDSMRKLEGRIKLPPRLRAEAEIHPVRWTTLSFGFGFITGAIVPLVFRATNCTGVRRVSGLAIKVAIVAGLIALQKSAFPEDRAPA